MQVAGKPGTLPHGSRWAARLNPKRASRDQPEKVRTHVCLDFTRRPRSRKRGRTTLCPNQPTISFPFCSFLCSLPVSLISLDCILFRNLPFDSWPSVRIYCESDLCSALLTASCLFDQLAVAILRSSQQLQLPRVTIPPIRPSTTPSIDSSRSAGQKATLPVAHYGAQPDAARLVAAEARP